VTGLNLRDASIQVTPSDQLDVAVVDNQSETELKVQVAVTGNEQPAPDGSGDEFTVWQASRTDVPVVLTVTTPEGIRLDVAAILSQLDWVPKD
jgi:hypothetical protein